MNEYLVTPLHKMPNRPWRQRRSQGIHSSAGAIQFVQAEDKKDAVRRIALSDPFSFGFPRTYMVVPMSGVGFFTSDIPTVTIEQGEPE